MIKLAMFALTCLAAAGSAIADPKAEEAGYLGVRLQRVEGGLAEALDIEADGGVLLGQVIEGSPADDAGLKEGDIVTSLDGKKVGTPDELRDGIRDRKAGENVSLQVLRDGAKRTVKVTLGKAETSQRTPLPGRMGDRIGRHVREMRLGGKHGWLGVHTQSLSGDLGEYFGAKDGGALVSEVVPDSPAAKLGLSVGDVITSVDGEAVGDPGDLRRIVAEHEEPTEVEVSWIRAKRAQTGKTTLEVKEGLGAFFEEPIGEDAMRDHLMWEEGPMRERVHALRMRAGEETEKALEELKEQVKKLEEQVRKLERRVD
jgi:S1-C subfamily serine protease